MISDINMNRSSSTKESPAFENHAKSTILPQKKKKQPSLKETDKAHKRKRTATIIPKLNNKRSQVLAADAQWCVCNVSKLNL